MPPRYNIQSTYDYLIEVFKGNVENQSIIVKSGVNEDVASGAWELVSNLSTAPNWMSSASKVRVKAGGNVADTHDGAGAQSVVVQGIEAITLKMVTEEITLLGANASALTSTLFWRTCTLFIPDGSVGTYGGSNAGPIVLENSAGTIDLLQIDTGESIAQQCCHTIEAGMVGIFLGFESHVEALKPAHVRIRTRNNIDNTTTPSPIITAFMELGIDGESQNQPKSAMGLFPAGSEIWVEAFGDGAITKVSAAMEFLMVKEDQINLAI